MGEVHSRMKEIIAGKIDEKSDGTKGKEFHLQEKMKVERME